MSVKEDTLLALRSIIVKQRRLSHLTSRFRKRRQQARDTEQELITSEMLDAIEGLDATGDHSNGIFFANTDDLMAFLESDQDSP